MANVRQSLVSFLSI